MSEPQEPQETSPEVPGDPKTQGFEYIKSNYYRVIHCDGIVGGMTPTADINIGIWSQRFPYPKRVFHAVTGSAGLVAEEVDREIKADIIRELEVGIVISPDLARELIKWLQLHLDQLDAVQALQNAEEAS